MFFMNKYYSIRLTILIICSLFSIISFGQNENDTIYRISEEPVLDTVEVVQQELQFVPEEEDEEEESYFIKKVYQGNASPITFRKLSDSFARDMKKDDAFWYVDYSFNKKQVQEKERSKPFMQQPLAQTILWILIVCGFVAFLIIYLTNSDIGLFRKKNRTISADEGSDVIPENIFEINYQREIEKAIQKKDYRLATRLMFLHLLKQMADKNIIKYQQDRTNFDYLLQLHGSKFYEDFFRLTRNYEYTWYGLFDVPDAKFQLIKADFERMNSQLK